MKVSVVIPARDEAVPLAGVLERIRELAIVDETIVVDDGSSDDTAQVAESHGAQVLHNPYSTGNGAAIKRGARAATGDIIVFMDADGQHDPADIPRLIAELGNGFDMVVGARGKHSHASFTRRIANAVYNTMAAYVTGRKVADLTSGFRAVIASRFREFLYLLPNGFSYPTTVTMAFFRAGYSVGFTTITAHRRIGKSHIRPLRDGTKFLLIIFKICTLYSPLKLFVPAAVFLLTAGLAWYAYTYHANYRFTNMSALLITSSFIVFMMGLISEQITALMYKDTNSSPSE